MDRKFSLDGILIQVDPLIAREQCPRVFFDLNGRDTGYMRLGGKTLVAILRSIVKSSNEFKGCKITLMQRFNSGSANPHVLGYIFYGVEIQDNPKYVDEQNVVVHGLTDPDLVRFAHFCILVAKQTEKQNDMVDAANIKKYKVVPDVEGAVREVFNVLKVKPNPPGM